MVKGEKIEMGGEEFVLPPLALNDLQDILPRVTGDMNWFSKEGIDTVIDATFAALKRNYPDITRDRVAALLDAGNMRRVFAVVMGVSGLERVLGEVKGAAAPSIGTTSTPIS